MNLPFLIVQIAGMFLVFAGILFGCAGTLGWVQGWLFLALFFGLTIALSLYLIRTDPALMAERQTGVGRADQEAWDKVLLVFAGMLFLALLAIPPLETVRLGVTALPAWLEVLGGGLLFLIGWAGMFWVFRSNTFLSPAVRVQSERKQQVVSTGPYAFVRHPMYGFLIPLVIGMELMLGSLWGLLPALVLFVIVGVRAVGEEQTLKTKLEGYEVYMSRVNYRLVPFIW